MKENTTQVSTLFEVNDGEYNGRIVDFGNVEGLQYICAYCDVVFSFGPVRDQEQGEACVANQITAHKKTGGW